MPACNNRNNRYDDRNDDQQERRQRKFYLLDQSGRIIDNRTIVADNPGSAARKAITRLNRERGTGTQVQLIRLGEKDTGNVYLYEGYSNPINLSQLNPATRTFVQERGMTQQPVVRSLNRSLGQQQ